VDHERHKRSDLVITPGKETGKMAICSPAKKPFKRGGGTDKQAPEKEEAERREGTKGAKCRPFSRSTSQTLKKKFGISRKRGAWEEAWRSFRTNCLGATGGGWLRKQKVGLCKSFSLKSRTRGKVFQVVGSQRFSKGKRKRGSAKFKRKGNRKKYVTVRTKIK